ncbi:MAG: hypothetical protein IJ788_02780 [Oscillospiraceae bacterium]|nr:hypothetical protein [Oscillospiraceae bacterium]
MALIFTDEEILAETLLYADEIKDAPKEPAHPKVTGAELKMAKTLIDAMVQDFKPEDYKDEYPKRLWDIINAKIQGKEMTVPQESEVTVIDGEPAPFNI